MRSISFLLALLPLLAGCGQAKEAFDTSAAREFRTSFVASCKVPIQQSGISEATAAKFCECGIDRIEAKYGVAERLTLDRTKIVAIMGECRGAMAS